MGPQLFPGLGRDHVTRSGEGLEGANKGERRGGARDSEEGEAGWATRRTLSRIFFKSSIDLNSL